MRLLIHLTALYILGNLGQAQVVDKLLFNCLPMMIRSTKLPFCELLTYYGFVKSVMYPELYNCLYGTATGPYRVGSEDELNCAESLNHDEALEMGITRYMKAMGFTEFK